MPPHKELNYVGVAVCFVRCVVSYAVLVMNTTCLTKDSKENSTFPSFAGSLMIVDILQESNIYTNTNTEVQESSIYTNTNTEVLESSIYADTNTEVLESSIYTNTNTEVQESKKKDKGADFM